MVIYTDLLSVISDKFLCTTVKQSIIYELIYNVSEGANGYFVEVSHAIFNYRIGERDGQRKEEEVSVVNVSS